MFHRDAPVDTDAVTQKDGNCITKYMGVALCIRKACYPRGLFRYVFEALSFEIFKIIILFRASQGKGRVTLKTTLGSECILHAVGSESLFGASISKRHGIFYTEALVDLNMLHVTWEDGSSKQWSCFAK